MKVKKIKIKYIPNCKICKWMIPGDSYLLCSAVGGRGCVDIHNTRLCKKLYEVKQ